MNEVGPSFWPGEEAEGIYEAATYEEALKKARTRGTSEMEAKTKGVESE